MRWSRLDENQRARLGVDEDLAEKALGPEPVLDAFQGSLFDLYHDLRRQTHADVGIPLPEDADPLVARHLLAMDAAYHEERNALLEERRQEMQHQRHGEIGSKR